ncbi:MAG: fumarylacetoacetate hydrolase family protein [Proteobacteria bacterium]|nr:fumarylacetoacetate hydrolase family protein [Pseudomonadota bacterium]MDA1058384.1 fumarylacetoacetate hydrolase family protein [Pseudomonadota bacterium]
MRPLPSRLLWDARLAGQTLEAADLGPITDQTAAYAIQDDITALSHSVPLGWKLGATSTASQSALGLEGPFYGPLLAPFCHANGAQISGAGSFSPGAEGEFALILDVDLPTRAHTYSEQEVSDAVAAVCPALEIAGSRLSGGIVGADPRHLIADGAANVAFVRGTPVADWRRFDLAAHRVALSINGDEKATGTGALVLGGPITALTWFVNILSNKGCGLAAGEIVTTGTCTGFIPLKQGDSVHVDFGDLGSVGATLA